MDKILHEVERLTLPLPRKAFRPGVLYLPYELWLSLEGALGRQLIRFIFLLQKPQGAER